MLKILLIFTTTFAAVGLASAQTFLIDSRRESARSDKRTGGILRGEFTPGNADIRLTINVPAFEMTLWQSGREVRTYPIGVGMPEYPVAISLRSARTIEWNPVWIPPSSDWIEKSSTVKPGEIVLPTDRRNPLGKVKIPLGYGYLLHQAKGPADMGGLVSHGCIRVLQHDLYDLAEKIIAARQLNVTAEQIKAAKSNKKTLVVDIEPELQVEITYDTVVVENGTLHVYPDVYGWKTNNVKNIRAELASSGIDDKRLTDAEIDRMLKGVAGKQKFIATAADIERGQLMSKGRYTTVLQQEQKPAGKERGRRQQSTK